MDLALTSDQVAILDAVESLARPFASPAIHDAGFALVSDKLDRELEGGGFLDVAFDPDLGAGSAALIVERLARLPYAVEAAASALVRPLFADLPRPLCLVAEGRSKRPIRFLKPGATVIVVGKDKVFSFIASQ